MKFLFTLCILLGALHSSFAQSITGRVYDASTGETLVGATILQKETQNGVSTNENGRFSLTLLPEKPSVLTISYLGYSSREVLLSDKSNDIKIRLIPESILSDEILVKATRSDASTPITYTNISQEEIREQNLGQDIPYLLQMAPSVVSSSDAGAGIGYTQIRIRGIDPTRINVTINGIPLNDSESHGVFWVNTPDLASSTNSIQIQRGVGTSTNGTAAFGATINMLTNTLSAEPYGEINTSVGSFNSMKNNIVVGTGLMENGWNIDGRLSRIVSDGYVDRAESNLNSYFLNVSRHGKKSLLKLNVFGGNEITYQAWYGTPEARITGNQADLEAYADRNFLDDAQRANLFNSDRRYNFYEYDNEVDDYGQNHVQLHYSYKFTEKLLANVSLHYTKGAGFFEQFRKDDDLSDYGLQPVTIGDATIESSDLIRRRWLDNDFYGAVWSIESTHDRSSLVLGGGYNQYIGDHFGEVVWARFASNSQIRDRYYENTGFKTDGNIYAKYSFSMNEKLSLFADVQARNVYYRYRGFDNDLRDITLNENLFFVNPKAGFVYTVNEYSRAFASVSVGRREPTRGDFVDATPNMSPRPELLIDYEAGYEITGLKSAFAVNLYFMDYYDQLILTGQVNDVGAYIRQNVERSYRAGIELQGAYKISSRLDWQGNITVSQNKILDFTEYLDDYDAGGQQAFNFTNTDMAFAPPVIANNMLTYSISDVSVSAMSRYIARQFLDNRADPNNAISAYWLTDIRFEFSPRAQFFGARINASLLVNNVFNHLYESNGYTFGYIFGGQTIREDFFYPQAGRNFLMQVSIGF